MEIAILTGKQRERIMEEVGNLVKFYNDSELIYVLPCVLRELSARSVELGRENDLWRIIRPLTQT